MDHFFDTFDLVALDLTVDTHLLLKLAQKLLLFFVLKIKVIVFRAIEVHENKMFNHFEIVALDQIDPQIVGLAHQKR